MKVHSAIYVNLCKQSIISVPEKFERVCVCVCVCAHVCSPIVCVCCSHVLRVCVCLTQTNKRRRTHLGNNASKKCGDKQCVDKPCSVSRPELCKCFFFFFFGAGEV